jgi:membrane associated rhomboid family serine protease
MILCTALFVVCQIQTLDGIRFVDAQRQWGAVVTLPFSAREDQSAAVQRQQSGPSDLWDGQWWRIPVTTFHHADVLHLLVNCLSAWILGLRLERRWGSPRLVLFLIPAATITTLTELLAGHTTIGFSGSICAMLGALIVLQKNDPREDDVPNGFIQLVLGLLLLAIPATALKLLHTANAAHISGVVYGSATAWICCGPGSHRRSVRAGFVMAHLLLIPAVRMATHPTHNGRYLWYLVVRDRVAPVEREPLLKRAIQIDPSLTGIWLRLAEHRIIEMDLPAAWTLLIEGLSHNPADAELIEAARGVWRRLPPGPDRDSAEAGLRRVFGDRAGAWSRQLRNTGLAAVKSGKTPTRPADEPVPDPKQFPLDRPIDLHWQPGPPAVEPSRPADPNRPDSALEGTAL